MKLACNLIANPKNNIIENAIVTIKNGKIASVKSGISRSCDFELKDAVVFPGLINIHDHLKYSWYKKIGNKGQYTSVYYWLKDLYDAFDPIVKPKESLKILFQLGVYKQIFSATTTVLNHSRYPKRVLPQDQEYIDIFDEFERELVVQPNILRKLTKHLPTFRDSSIVNSHAIAMMTNSPFMIHAAEGRNGETKNEIKKLNHLGVLTKESILVHCINTDQQDINLIKDGGCSVVWCPYSSEFITGKTPNIKAFIENDINVSVGTDSSCSGGTNLLDELRFAKIQYKKEFSQTIESSTLFDMVTDNAAKALKKHNQLGYIKDGYSADIAIVDKKTDNPYDDIINSNAESIIALLHNGIFVYGDEILIDKFPTRNDSEYFYFSINGRKKVVIGNPKELINQAKSVFSLDESAWFNFIPKEINCS